MTCDTGFTDWLLQQQHREDPVGMLARFAATDKSWPRTAGSLIGYFVTHLSGRVRDYDTNWEPALYQALHEYDAMVSPPVRADDEAGSEEPPPATTWEGVYPVPGMKIPRCAWCRRAGEEFFLVVYEIPAFTREVQTEVVCARCTGIVSQYVEMRKQGRSRKFALWDLSARER